MSGDGRPGDPGAVTVDNVHERMLALIDRELTSPARAAAYAARWAPATAVEYVVAIGALRGWCRPPSHGGVPARWLSYLPCTSETLALFAEYQLVQASPPKAPATVRKWISGIRAWHRLHGAPVPDGVPALAVLTRVEATLKAHGWEPKTSDPLDFDQIVALVGVCDPEWPRDLRDAAWLLVGYATQLDAGRLRSLRLADFGPLTAEGMSLAPGDGTGEMWLPHWARDGRHDPRTCPPCAAAAWTGYLRGRGLTGSAWWLRPVDQHARVAGIDERWVGKRAPDGRMSTSALGVALADLLDRAGLTDPAHPERDTGRYTLTSVSAGGLAHLRAQGATVARLTASGVVPAGSRRRIVDAVRSAETWPAGVAAVLDRADGLP